MANKLTRIHINQHVLRRNYKTGERDPVITAKDYKDNRYGNQADIVVDGEVVASVVYSPDKPLSCGARLWVETRNEVVVK